MIEEKTTTTAETRAVQRKELIKAGETVDFLVEEKREVFELLFETITGLMRENKEILWSSMVKDTMKRKRPAFAERAHGYRTFSDLLEDAQKRGFITLRTDPTSGTYVVVGFAKPGR